MKMYARFGAMIATSTIVMLGFMYLNTTTRQTMCFSVKHEPTWRS